MPKIAHLEADHAANAAMSGTDKLTKVATQTTERTADATGELQQETLRRSAKGTAKLGQLFMTLFVEQARHNLQLVTAVAKAQGDFVRGSFERMSQLSGRYREIVQAGMKAMAFTARA
jgi:hypothetical protein